MDILYSISHNYLFFTDIITCVHICRKYSKKCTTEICIRITQINPQIMDVDSYTHILKTYIIFINFYHVFEI